MGSRRYLRAERWVEHTLEVQSTIGQIVTAVSDAESNNRGFLLSHAQRLRAQSLSAQRAVPLLLDHLTSLTGDNPSQQQRVRDLALLIQPPVLAPFGCR